MPHRAMLHNGRISSTRILTFLHGYPYKVASNESRELVGDNLNLCSLNHFSGGECRDIPDFEKSEESYRNARADFDRAGRVERDDILNGASSVLKKLITKGCSHAVE